MFGLTAAPDYSRPHPLPYPSELHGFQQLGADRGIGGGNGRPQSRAAIRPLQNWTAVDSVIIPSGIGAHVYERLADGPGNGGKSSSTSDCEARRHPAEPDSVLFVQHERNV
jgi:hypothetical protein